MMSNLLRNEVTAAAILTSIFELSARSHAEPPCDESASIFLETNCFLHDQQGSLTVEIASNQGQQILSFVSGTSAGSIVAAINTLSRELGVVAACFCDTACDEAGVLLFSTQKSASAFVSVEQIQSSLPIVFVEPGVGKPSFSATTYGTTGMSGDANCDHHVNQLDLGIVIDQWGGCSGGGECAADLTGDGLVDVDDLLIVINHWDNSI